jgi:hypothetical protein
MEKYRYYQFSSEYQLQVKEIQFSLAVHFFFFFFPFKD